MITISHVTTDVVNNNAASFASQSSQYLDITNTASSNTLQAGDVDLLVACWVKHTTVTGDMYYISKGNDYTLRYSGSAGAKFRWFLGSAAINSTEAPVAGTWYLVIGYHIAATNQIGIIVNNGAAATNTTSSQGVTTESFSLGRNSVGTGYFNGLLDSVIVCKPSAGWLTTNLTAFRDYLYNSGNGRRSNDFKFSNYYLNGNSSGCVSFWDLGEQSGTRYDSVGNNHLTSYNSVGYGVGFATGAIQDPLIQMKSQNGGEIVFTADDNTELTIKYGNNMARFKLNQENPQIMVGNVTNGYSYIGPNGVVFSDGTSQKSAFSKALILALS